MIKQVSIQLVSGTLSSPGASSSKQHDRLVAAVLFLYAKSPSFAQALPRQVVEMIGVRPSEKRWSEERATGYVPGGKSVG